MVFFRSKNCLLEWIHRLTPFRSWNGWANNSLFAFTSSQCFSVTSSFSLIPADLQDPRHSLWRSAFRKAYGVLLWDRTTINCRRTLQRGLAVHWGHFQSFLEFETLSGIPKEMIFTKEAFNEGRSVILHKRDALILRWVKWKTRVSSLLFFFSLPLKSSLPKRRRERVYFLVSTRRWN